MAVATFAPRPLHPQGKLSGTHRVTGWTRPRASVCVWKINLLALAGIEPWLPRRPARNLFAISTVLSRPPIYMLLTPKRMWIKPLYFLLPCRPRTTPRANKRTITQQAPLKRLLRISNTQDANDRTSGWTYTYMSAVTTFGFINLSLSTTWAPNFRENIPKPTAYLKTKSFILLLQHSDEIIHSYVFTAYEQKLVWFREGRGSLYKLEARMWWVRTTSWCRPLPVIRNGHILFQIPTESTRSPEDEGRIFLLKRRWQKSADYHLNNTCRKSLKTYISCILVYFYVAFINN